MTDRGDTRRGYSSPDASPDFSDIPELDETLWKQAELVEPDRIAPAILAGASGPSQLELVVIDRLRRGLGCPESAGWLFTSGGSAASLDAFVAAREAAGPPELERAVRGDSGTGIGHSVPSSPSPGPLRWPRRAASPGQPGGRNGAARARRCGELSTAAWMGRSRAAPCCAARSSTSSAHWFRLLPASSAACAALPCTSGLTRNITRPE